MPRETRLLTDAEIRQVETMAGIGLKVEQIAAVIGISKPSFDRRQADQPGVSDAIERGRAKAASSVLQTLFKMAVSGKCVAATIFWAKTREGWREKDSLEISWPNGAPLQSNKAEILIILPDNGKQAPKAVNQVLSLRDDDSHL
jgi:hypothetical protein